MFQLGRQIQERKIGQSRGVTLGDGGFKKEEESDEIAYTGRLFGGLIDDVKRKAKYYASDFSDGLTLQCFASFVFLYFAVLTPIITFGGLLGDATDNNIAVVESLVGACIATGLNKKFKVLYFYVLKIQIPYYSGRSVPSFCRATSYNHWKYGSDFNIRANLLCTDE